jgi:hypothetical protein
LTKVIHFLALLAGRHINLKKYVRLFFFIFSGTQKA